MHVQKLLKLLEQPTRLLPNDIPLLEALVKEYPYFYLGHALLAKAYAQAQGVAQDAVQQAAAYAPDGTYFRKWLENKCSPLPVFKERTTKSAQEDPLANNYLERIAKRTAKKTTNEKTIQQFAVIDAILEENLQFDPFIDRLPLKEEAVVDLAESKTILDERFATETLANIMVKQKKYKRAIEIYTHLIAKFPEKKAYFSDIIENLTSQL
ncbi:MAG TPA: hypothetical protein VK133_03570 [Amoebophilaceae bacterium]|nr:hypothetical protein [Amoebophilaceae bacterium]